MLFESFVMLLVVLGHVPMYCYHQTDVFSFSLIPSTFHLALFFFISGWFLNNANDNSYRLWELVKKKFVQLIVPTVVFYLLFCWLYDIDIVDNLWSDKYKAGYWFCIVLFGFYIILTLTLAITKTVLWGTFLCLLFSALTLMFNTNAMTRLLTEWHIPNVLCLQQWQYFFFFYIGFIAHRYQNRFFAWLDNGRVMGIGILLFFGSLLIYYQQPMGLLGIKLGFLVWGGLGAILSFAFFRKYEQSFSSQTYVGRTLQYIGRRSLDVYLLHFFFLPRNLENLGSLIMGNGNPTVELFVSLTIALIVIAMCLLIGNVIRLSPTLAHWTLGAKKHHE